MNILKSNYSKEIIGGLTTFFTMSYIVVVNPQITGGLATGIPMAAALTSTVFLCFVMTLFSGFYAKLPYAVGPGMGINIFVVFSLIQGKHLPWQTAMGIIFISGFLFFLITISPLRTIIYYALPESLRHGLSAGIGVFLAYIGFKNMGLLKLNSETFVSIASLNVTNGLGILGFLVAFALFYKKKSYAFLLPIILVSVLAVILGKVHLGHEYFSLPDFSSFFQLDIKSALKLSFVSTIITLLLTCIFDSTATLIALVDVGNFKARGGEPLRLKESLIVNSASSLASSFMGTTPGLIYLESAAGIEAGAKGGLASIVTACCFVPCLFLSPLIRLIPSYATASVLVFVGILMTFSLSHLKGKGLDEVVPVFFAVILMPLSSSITAGVFAGILSYITIKIFIGKYKEVSLPLYIIGVICIGALLLDYFA
jgi:AGZA family xanthine/uracil permease-like MFS transporter